MSCLTEPSIYEYRETPKFHTKTQLIDSRKTQAIASAQFFAANQYFLAAKRHQSATHHTKPMRFPESPAKVQKSLKTQNDLENLSKKFTILKHGIHSKTLPKFSENLERINLSFATCKFSSSVKQSPKKNTQVDQTKNLRNWKWVNESLDIVAFHELKTSIKIQQENFNRKRESVYSEYWAKMIKKKESKEKLAVVMRKKQDMLIQNRICGGFRTEEGLHKRCFVRTSGFIQSDEKEGL